MSTAFPDATPAELSGHVPVGDLPDSIDWRDSGAVTDVKNQGSCGSCWAFSAAETLESHIFMQTGSLLELSPQQLVSCSKNPKECGGTGGCSGSTQWNAFDYTVGAGGIATEESYPYTSGTGMDGDCLSEQIVPAATITGYERLPANNYSALMNAVATLGPIAISSAASPWQFYSSGIYDGTQSSMYDDYDVDHAIQLVGYGGSGSAPYPDPQPQGSCGSTQDEDMCEAMQCYYCFGICMPSNCADAPANATAAVAAAAAVAVATNGAGSSASTKGALLRGANSGSDDYSYWLVRNSWGRLVVIGVLLRDDGFKLRPMTPPSLYRTLTLSRDTVQ
mmetsp:Transcript_72690/g.207038  ORF Transcript_72690/g.207038 Transcript_72690/m.207038 type:complete len:335 (+) Transcript_72690:482-1486(+)